MTAADQPDRVLIASQGSRLEGLCASHPWEGDVIDPAHYVDADGNRHPTSGWQPGDPPGTGRRWVPAVRATLPGRPTFAELCERFPDSVRPTPTGGPAWGSAWWAEAADGFPRLFRERWDTSG